MRTPSDAKYLLLDSRIIDVAEGVRLTLGEVEKDEANPLFVEDRPWEVRFDNLYANVTFDETDGLVTWRGGRNLAKLAGKPIRLHFEVKAARLYAFGFEGSAPTQ